MNREDFKMLEKDLTYFDNGATTFKPKCVVDAIKDYYENYSANAHRGDYEISFKASSEYENARSKVAKYINASYEEVIFTSGTTESINLVANGFFKNHLKRGDEVLITLSEHASNVLPWYELAKEIGIKVEFIDLDENHEVTLENVKNKINKNTRLISLAHITNVIGDVRPIKEIAALAHQNGALMLVDAAQSIGHIKTDVKDLDIDFLCFSAHKMMGPTGIGILYGKKDLLEKINPTKLGGGMNESFDSINEVHLKELPDRLEAGTPNIAGAIGLGAAVDYINEIGIDNISKYEVELKKYMVQKLKNIEHIKIINETTNSGIITFNVEDVFAQDASFYLNKYNVCTRAGNHCAKILKNEIGIKNTVRISLYLYNTKEECDKVVKLLEDKNKIIEEMI